MEKDKNFWISYDGIVTLGIDSSKLDVKVDGENVKIHIPEAKVLSSKPNTRQHYQGFLLLCKKFSNSGCR